MHTFAAIDPLALMLPTSVYITLVNKLHPNEPPEAVLTATMRTMTAEEKQFAVVNAKRVGAYAQAVERAAG